MQIIKRDKMTSEFGELLLAINESVISEKVFKTSGHLLETMGYGERKIRLKIVARSQSGEAFPIYKTVEHLSPSEIDIRSLKEFEN
jgi:hypothetical protein